MYSDIYVEGAFFSWFDVNRSTFHEDIRKNDFCIFVPGDFELWHFVLKFALPVTHVHGPVYIKFEVSTEKGDGRTDGQSATIILCDLFGKAAW